MVIGVYVTDFRRETLLGRRGWAFQWPRDRVDSQTFNATLAALKKAVPWEDRSWRPDTLTWWVADGYDLSAVFGNWNDEIEKVKRQMVLPGF